MSFSTSYLSMQAQGNTPFLLPRHLSILLLLQPFLDAALLFKRLRSFTMLYPQPLFLWPRVGEQQKEVPKLAWAAGPLVELRLPGAVAR